MVVPIKEISILAVLADRDFSFRAYSIPVMISILAVLADRDFTADLTPLNLEDFNPRGPCGPRRPVAVTPTVAAKFQSSRSLWTATKPLHSRSVAFLISILAVLADRDLLKYETAKGRAERFQSSRSLRTATRSTSPITAMESLFQSSRSLRTATFSDI